MPVIIYGVEGGAVTHDGSGSQRFASLTEALAAFPDLDVRRNTPRFTRAGAGHVDGEAAVWFLTWEAVRRGRS